MYESLLEELESILPGKAFLSVEDVSAFLNCDAKHIYNWTKRADARKRPPRIRVGSVMKFPRKEFLKWLCDEQAAQHA